MADALLGAVVAVALCWLVLAVLLWRAAPDSSTLRSAAAALPQLLQLVTRLARDSAVPWPTRVRLWLVIAYLASPIDLVPDVIPVIGYADDVILSLWVLRSCLRRAGPETITRLWPGTPDGLTAVQALIRW